VSKHHFEAPSPEAYKRAILELRPIHDNHLEMLRTHFQSPDHTITASQLAAAVGYQNYNAVNLQYGTFADRLCNSLHKDPDTRLSILVTFEKEGIEQQEHWKLVMRPEVVQALTDLGWFATRAAGA
jgi:hypothetical protein